MQNRNWNQSESRAHTPREKIVHLLWVYCIIVQEKNVHKRPHRKSSVFCASRLSRLTNWWPAKKIRVRFNDVKNIHSHMNAKLRCDVVCKISSASLKGKIFSRLNRQIFTFNILFSIAKKSLARRKKYKFWGKWLPKVSFFEGNFLSESTKIPLETAVNLQQQRIF